MDYINLIAYISGSVEPGRKGKKMACQNHFKEIHVFFSFSFGYDFPSCSEKPMS